LAFDDNQLMSVVMLFLRKIRFLNEEILLGGIGAVCTAENFRKQGVATILIKRG